MKSRKSEKNIKVGDSNPTGTKGSRKSLSSRILGTTLQVLVFVLVLGLQVLVLVLGPQVLDNVTERSCLKNVF